MLLSEFVLQVYRVERCVSGITTGTYLKTLGAFSRFLGHPARFGDLGRVNDWLCDVGDRLRPSTGQTYRSQLLAVWRLAWELDPAGVPRPRVRPSPRWSPSPWCWTEPEVSKILLACEHLQGSHDDCRRSDWWSLFVQVGWQTGLRRTDLHLLRHTDLGSGQFAWPQHKTGKLLRCQVSRETVALIHDRLPGDPIFKLPKSEEAFRQQWRRIVTTANVRPGPFKYLRKSAGNYAERLQSGAGCILLGNEQRTFSRHYLDLLSAEDRIPRPPHLG